MNFVDTLHNLIANVENNPSFETPKYRLRLYLVCHAAEIAALVEQMQREHAHHTKLDCAGCQTLAELEKEKP